MKDLLLAYVVVAAIGALFVAVVFGAEEDLLDLPAEGRVVLGIVAGLLWPLVALLGVAWFVRAAWRGCSQVVALVMPARKSKLPRAEVRR